MNFGTVRIVYTVGSIALAGVAYDQSERFIDTSSTPLDVLSYIGTIATIIGLVIAVCEVIHNVNVSRSIKDEASEVFSRVKKIENASTISECLAALDDVNSAIVSNDYRLALKTYQFFRKLCVKIGVDLGANTVDERLGTLGSMEQDIMAATHSSEEAPLTPVQKKNMTKKILIIKRSIEEANPANGGNNATT